jgi:excisionase family DNA binding protein
MHQKIAQPDPGVTGNWKEKNYAKAKVNNDAHVITAFHTELISQNTSVDQVISNKRTPFAAEATSACFDESLRRSRLINAHPELRITPGEAADLLGISRRKAYGLAAPHGPITYTRIGRSVRYFLKDVLSYETTCRLTETRETKAASDSNSKKRSMARPFVNQSSFRKAIQNLKPNNTI